MLKKVAGSGILREALFLGADVGGMRLQPTCGGAQGMLYVEHLVIEDKSDSIRGDVRAVQTIVHHDLVE